MNASIATFWPLTALARTWLHLTLRESSGERSAIVLLAPLLLVVAFWNGFPLIYYDTGAYVLEGLGRHFLVERSPVYSLFLRFAGAGFSLWTVVAIQATVTAFVIVECARAVAPKLELRWFLLLGSGLILATGLPWYVGEVEPDCFAPIVVLTMYVLAFHSRALGRVRTGIMLVTASFAAAAHTSHLLLALGLWIALVLFTAIGLVARRSAFRPRPDLVRPAITLILATALVLSGNYFLTRQVFVSRAGPAFLFARMLQDRLVLRLLEDTCPNSKYRLCAYKDLLPPTANAWLWAPYSPFLKLGGFDGTMKESERIVRDSLARYPLENLEAAVADAARQFGSFKTGDQVEPQQWAISAALSNYLPTQVAPYLAARQQEGEIAFRRANLLHVPVGWASLVVLIGLFVVSLRRARFDAAAFLGFVFLSLVANATICGTLSNPHDRYQSRMMWLAPLAVVLTLAARQSIARPADPI